MPTLQAELLSREAEEGLADRPPDRLLAATRDALYNALVCTRLAPEIGRERVYQLAPSADHLLHAETGVSRDVRGKVLGDGGFGFEALAERHSAGWRFEVVPADAEDAAGVSCLLVIRSDGRLDLPSLDRELDQALGGDRQLVFQPSSERRPGTGASRSWPPRHDGGIGMSNEIDLTVASYAYDLARGTCHSPIRSSVAEYTSVPASSRTRTVRLWWSPSASLSRAISGRLPTAASRADLASERSIPSSSWKLSSPSSVSKK